MQKRKRFVCGLFAVYVAIAGLSSVHAMVVDTLYTVELPAEDKTVAERNTLFAKAFEHILFRMTGDLQVGDDLLIKQVKRQIDKYVSSFYYKSVADNKLQLVVQFDESMINDLLRSVNKAYLGKNRPVTMIWLVIESTQGTELVGGDSQATTKLEEVALNQAVPVVLPLLDLVDQAEVSVDDIISVSSDILEQAAKRYQADVILVGRITQFAGEWRSRWHLLGDPPIAWQTSSKELDEQFSDLVPSLISNLITRYTSSNLLQLEDTNSVKINVAGIDSLEHYAKILSYLHNLSTVSQVEVTNVTSGGATFDLQTNSGSEAIKKVISLDRVLQRVVANDFEQDLLELNYKVRS